MKKQRFGVRTDNEAVHDTEKFVQAILEEMDDAGSVFEIRTSPLFDVEAVTSRLTQLGFIVDHQARPSRLVVTRLGP